MAIVLGVLFFATIMCVVACLVHCTISLIACLMPNGQLGLPAAATERVEGHYVRRPPHPPDDESYAYPPTIWRSPLLDASNRLELN